MTTGIPTTVSGTRFRSRLEARWAAFFDLLAWPWEYEPIDLEGYIPDFVLLFKHAPLLVEVKPAFSLDDLEQYVPKIRQSGWKGESLIVGATLWPSPWSGGFTTPGLLSQDCGVEDSSGERYSWEAGELTCCSACREPSIYHPCMAWYCYRCGVGGKIYNGPELDFVTAWRKAGNTVQWRAR